VSRIKNIIIGILIIILLLIGAFYSGYYYKKCPQLNYAIKDSNQKITVESPKPMANVPLKNKIIIKKISLTVVDSNLVKIQKHIIDSLELELLAKGIEEHGILDTLLPPYYDSFYLDINYFKKQIDSMNWKIKEREVKIDTRYIYIPCPELPWYYATIYRNCTDIGIIILDSFLSYELGRASK
jgi:hypothetical protein